MGLQPKLWANVQADPHPRPYHSERTARRTVEFIVLRQTGSERLCRPIQFLRIKRISFFPNAQSESCNLARQSQPRHFGAHAFLFETPQISAVWFSLSAARSCSDKHVF